MDYSQYLQTGEDGVQSFDSTKFEKDLQSEIDSKVSKGVDAFKTAYDKKLAESKMSEQEKFKSEKEEFDRFKKQSLVDINVLKAKVKLEGKGFSEKEIDILLKNVNDNEEESLSVIDTLVSERASLLENSKKSALEELQKNQPNPDTSSNSQTGNAEPVARRTAEEIKNMYNK